MMTLKESLRAVGSKYSEQDCDYERARNRDEIIILLGLPGPKGF